MVCEMEPISLPLRKRRLVIGKAVWTGQHPAVTIIRNTMWIYTRSMGLIVMHGASPLSHGVPNRLVCLLL